MVRQSLFALLASVLIVAGGATAFATQTVQNDAAPMPQAAMTLTQAIAVAEQQAGGRAVRADVAHSKAHGWIYDVEVVADAKVFDIQVSAQTGTVLASSLDSRDQDNARDEERDDEHGERD